MKIIVCIKQSGFIYHPLAIDSSEGDIDHEKMVYMLNPNDAVALEAAIRIKEKIIHSKVTIITAGPKRTEESLRYAFAFGADRMIRVNCESLDASFTAMALTEVIKYQKPDIILCGKKSIDTNNGQTGAFIAEFLDMPQVSGIVELKISPKGEKAFVERYLGRGDREVVECGLPALFTVEPSMYDPRYPTLPNRFLSEKQEIELIELDSLGISHEGQIDSSKSMDLTRPRPKPKKVFIPDSHLHPAERLQLIMSGGIAQKKGDLFKATPDDAAKKILDAMVQEKIIE